MGTRGSDFLPVQEHPNDALLVPVALSHPPAVGAEPPDVRQTRAHRVRALEVLAAPEARVVAPHLEQAARELVEPLAAIVPVPVEPGDLVVLAPGVVVAGL